MTRRNFAPFPDFIQHPPDLDFADPETDRRCFSCESVLLDDGQCAVCEPRCLVEDSPLRLSVVLAPPPYDQGAYADLADDARKNGTSYGAWESLP